MTALTDVTEDLVVAALAGYLATKAMEPGSMRLYELESEEDRQREDAVRPGPPYEIAAKKIAGSLGRELHGVALKRASMAMHYGPALSWSPLYGVLRRTRDVHPLLAGLGTGAAMSLVADEAMTPLLGYSAPNRAYPLDTQRSSRPMRPAKAWTRKNSRASPAGESGSWRVTTGSGAALGIWAMRRHARATCPADTSTATPPKRR